ncbi:hypothetical protein AB6D15_15165 [Vibrio splendidus]
MNLEAIKQKNRRRNSGGIPPNAQQHALKLIAALKRLRQHYKPKKEPDSSTVSDYDRALLYFLYLWLTGQLKACQDARDIPDLDVVSGSQPCQAHRLRKLRKTRGALGLFLLSLKTQRKSEPCRHGRFTLRHHRGN